MSGYFDEPPAPPRKPAQPPARPQRSRALIGTLVVLVVAFVLLSAFTGLWTDRLWFQDLGYGGVFTTLISTRVVLFVVFGLLMAAVVAINLWIAYRLRPTFRAHSPEQASLDRYREVVTPIRVWLLLGISGAMAVFAGVSASGQWRNFLLWRNGGEFGTTDPYFNRDAGFFVFDLPWLHFLVDFGMAASVVGILAAALVHYLYGGIRLQATSDKVSGAAQAQLSVLVGLFVLFKAVDYYLDRFDLTTGAGGLITGLTFTDENAVLPSKNILMFIALICAILFFANVFRRTWMLPGIGLGLLVLSSILLGLVWPGIVQNFQVNPSEPDKEAPYIERNIAATRDAYQIADTEITDYAATASLEPEQLAADAQSIPGIRLLDPSLVSDTFTQLQQVRGYYGVPDVLDVDRYEIDGEERDMVVAVRELNQAGLPGNQQNWANLHTVYTHGYGMVAAYGNQRDAQNQPAGNTGGEPIFAEEDIPPRGDLSDLGDGYVPQIYFGENSPTYSIVGKEEGGDDIELDIPEGDANGGQARTNTYDGETGVGVGGLASKILYAIRFGEPNIVLSGRVNENSRILYDRHPSDRVEKVAPWLTVDNDIYPAVVDGRVLWIVDAYTVSDRYPLSEKRSLSDMTEDRLNPIAAFNTLPTDEINYMRNSVKAVVDAFDGTVTLYAWDEEDPVLDAWSSAFDGVIKPRETIPDALLDHMRYPEDLFKVQRHLLQEYHVTDAQTFYAGTDRWTVPSDPTRTETYQPPYRLSVQTPTGDDEPTFSLTSVFTPAGRQNLASFISVDGDASKENYGQIRILRLPGNTQIQGPQQIANAFAADESIQNAVLPFTRTNSQAIYGNLLTLPVGDGLLYVQPLYTRRQGSGEGTYPVLRFVLASFGRDVGYGQTLAEALDDVLGSSQLEQEIDGSEPDEGEDPPPDEAGTPDPEPGPDEPPASVEALLQQAEGKFAEAQRALADGDLGAYQDAVAEARRLIQRALQGGDTGE
ncbi:MAG: UPF0182 family protein [Nocardioides sp.]|nr:UPF0182 family protein [Nocardioides sp.]